MTQAQPLDARDLPDHQYGKALAAKWMKGMGYLGRSQSLAGLECSSKQPCRPSETEWCKVRSSSSSNLSSRRISNRDRLDIGPSGQHMIKRVAEAIVERKTRVLDFDLRAYFDNIRHDRLLEKVAQRVDDA